MATATRTLVLAGAALLLIGAALILRPAYGIHRDYYWTPQELALTPEEASDRVEIYLDGKHVQDSSRLGTLRIRMNNAAAVTRGPLAVGSFFLGGGVALLVAAFVSRRRASFESTRSA